MQNFLSTLRGFYHYFHLSYKTSGKNVTKVSDPIEALGPFTKKSWTHQSFNPIQ